MDGDAQIEEREEWLPLPPDREWVVKWCCPFCGKALDISKLWWHIDLAHDIYHDGKHWMQRVH